MKVLQLNKSVFLSNLPYLAKCVIGVILCYILYKEIPRYPFYWALVSVVIAISPDNSNRLAYDRMKANVLGCGVGLCLYPVHIPNLVLLCLGITLTISVGIALRLTSTLRSAMAALIIVLIATFSACGGLALGCTINQQHIGLMFGMVITPMIFFGCTYYPWSALKTFPILQKAVLINPLVYASEGMRATLAPQFSHLPVAAVLGALLFFDVLLLVVGLQQFEKKAVS